MLFSFLKTMPLRETSLFLLFSLCATYGVISGGAWSLFAFVFVMAAFVFWFFEEKKLPHFSKKSLFFFLALVFLFSFSAVHTGFEPEAVKDFYKMTGVSVLLLLLFSPAGQVKRFPIMPLAVCLIMGFLLYDLVMLYVAHFSSALNKSLVLAKYNRGFSYEAALFFPVLAGIWQENKKSRRNAIILILLCLSFLSAFSMTYSRAAQVGFVGGLVLALSAWRFPRLTFSLVLLGCGLSFLWPFFAPAIFTYAPELHDKLPLSWQARLEIWDYTARYIPDHLLWGIGVGQTPHLQISSPFQGLFGITLDPVDHSHNVIIQTILETGLVGLLLLALFLGQVLRKMSALSPFLKIFALAAFFYCFWLSCVAYDFWTDSLWVAFGLTAWLFNHMNLAEN